VIGIVPIARWQFAKPPVRGLFDSDQEPPVTPELAAMTASTTHPAVIGAPRPTRDARHLSICSSADPNRQDGRRKAELAPLELSSILARQSCPICGLRHVSRSQEHLENRCVGRFEEGASP
jgi:hypothetical protein